MCPCSDGIVRWIKKKTGPAAATLASKDDLAAQEKEAEVLVVGYFKDFKGADYEAFTKVAQATEDATFLQTSDAATGKAAGLSSAGITIITNFPGRLQARCCKGRGILASLLVKFCKCCCK